MRLLLDLLALVRALSADRVRLALENVVLRQQLNVMTAQREARTASTMATGCSGCLMHRSARGMEGASCRGEAGDRDPLASPGVSLLLEVEVAAQGRAAGSIAPEVIRLIRRMSAWRTSSGARPRIQSKSSRCSGTTIAESTVAKYMVAQKDRAPSADLAQLHRQPHGRERGVRLLHRADADLQGALRSSSCSEPRPPAHPARQRDPPSHGGVDGAADHRGVPRRRADIAALSPPRPRLDLRRSP